MKGCKAASGTGRMGAHRDGMAGWHMTCDSCRHESEAAKGGMPSDQSDTINRIREIIKYKEYNKYTI